MFARIRRNFCQYSWAPMWDHCGRKDLKQLVSVIGAMGKTGRWPEDVNVIVLVDLYLFSSDVGPLWSQRSEGTSVSTGCFGRECQRKRHCLRNF